jgi:hypothetical protein
VAKVSKKATWEYVVALGFQLWPEAARVTALLKSETKTRRGSRKAGGVRLVAKSRRGETIAEVSAANLKELQAIILHQLNNPAIVAD